MMNKILPVAIIGGGPVGIAAAAHLVKRNEAFILFESGKEIGTNFLDYGHVRLFSPWEYNIDEAAKELLLKHHISLPPKDELPLGEEIVFKYLKPLSQLPEMKPYIHMNSRVLHVGKKGFDKVKTKGRDQAPFILRVKVDNKEEKIYEAKAVIDATGTWQNPNPLNAEGLITDNEKRVSDQIYYGIPDVLNRDKDRYKNKTVAVVGSGHSAINTLLDLTQLKEQTENTEIIWILRKQDITEVFGGEGNDQLPARGQLGTRLRNVLNNGEIKAYPSMFIESISLASGGKLNILGHRQQEQKMINNIDEIIANTGARPDFQFLKEIRHTFDSALECVPDLADLIDPNIHSCGTVRPHGEKELRQPEKNFYIIGSKSYGRAPTFLLATGYEQARSVVAYITGDKESAERVELKLPETGVCKLTPKPSAAKTSCCCD
ncbi:MULTISPECIES: NAD(P)-binding domain-containing protein [Bacillus]|uniref:Putative secreted protein n=2 Tax=Bacillota TaxID=1239 RepID=A0A7Z0WXW2_9BACI|nr:MULTISPECIES: NAD(P)-binding domain-containing protein [Bacillus]OLF90875.1 putative secreted protein [Bacillus paralicheniformis]TWJ65735.1 Ferredoxin--NADP reductase [Bacillus paralicheniformis]TWJ84672.1 Ferredoxin--NADP reductase [Bacillus paralicheniformis]WEA72070.1 NAD(P)-binding domain-containing protein [Bacillus paralicheniformis]WOH91897.1 NAD(P)-binding domain-containing protein [Bacillus paralicheniformis]